MYLNLDYQSGEPIYRQIVEQIKYKIATGELEAGARLASIRELAGQLKINPRTVVKAYEELAGGGLVVMRHGQGVFVKAENPAAPARARRKVIEQMARRMLSEASRMGADGDEVLKIVEEVAKKMRANR